MLLSDVVSYRAGNRPDDPALLYEEQVVTFAQLDSRLNRLANALGDLAECGDRVAILSESRPEYLDCYYGVTRAGMVLAMLNFRLSPAELVRIINDASPTVLVVEPEYLETIRALRNELTSLRRVLVLGKAELHPGEMSFEALLAAADENPPTYRPDPDDVAWLVYTSGTTGMAKGAMLTHRNLLTGCTNLVLAWERVTGEIEVCPWPMFHVAGAMYPIAHLIGNTVVMMRSFQAEDLLALIERHRCTRFTAAPTVVSMLLRHPALESYDLSSLRRIGYGAAPMPPEILRAAISRFPGVRFIAGFGMTELGGSATYLSPDAHDEAAAGDSAVLGSVGRPMPLTQARVVAPDMTDVPIGDVGELVFRGEQVFTGYWGRPEETAESIVDGWLRTGDLARLDDQGNIYVVDRQKDMIITGGENVYSREVEDVVYQHPCVAEVAVIGTPDSDWGEQVVAVVQPRPGATVVEAELIEFCRDRIASYKKPKRVITVDELPRSAAGKILKRELREIAASKLKGS